MKARPIMIQGTMSNAGKSFIAAGLCRVFKQDGYRVAPFKSQNMALNSYITGEGLEIGRAQAMQAEAAGIKPAADMNPVLLKPNSSTGSQVILNGEVLGNMRAMEYYRSKKKFIPDIIAAYERLAAENDIIVIEGAGSPAEINLRENDIVNMGLAALVKSPVLLAGDIDRGGVFAALYGTVKLLEPEEQKYIKGLIINKFRGDRAILEHGLRMIEERLGIPVIGSIPMEHIDLDDEDSLSERLNKKKVNSAVDIAVIRFPHISNFTDFNIFDRIDGAGVRYTGSAYELEGADIIILPGSKNTMSDLIWLRESGLEAAVAKAAHEGRTVIGICGGYQMLGERLYDPYSVEHGGDMRGMGLLGAETVFSREKTRSRTEAEAVEAVEIFGTEKGCRLSGYEIHMGQTIARHGCKTFLKLSDGREDGLINGRGNVIGTYLHGIFDSPGLAEAMVKKAAAEKGISLKDKEFDNRAYAEAEYDKLANLIRTSLDIKAVYRIIGEGV